jgi:hypothetical protein
LEIRHNASLAAKFSNWETVLTVKCIFIAVRVIIVAAAAFFIGSAAVAQRPQIDTPLVEIVPSPKSALREAPEPILRVGKEFLEAIFQGDQSKAELYLTPNAVADFVNRFPEIKKAIGKNGDFIPYYAKPVFKNSATAIEYFKLNYVIANDNKIRYVELSLSVKKGEEPVVDYIDVGYELDASIGSNEYEASNAPLSQTEIAEQQRQRENMGAAIQFIGRNIALALAAGLFLALFSAS